MSDLVDDDEKAEKAREEVTKAAVLEAKQRRDDLRKLMATPHGRRFVWWLLDEKTGVHSGTFTGEALGSAFAEGRRSIGRELMVEVKEVATADYVRMLWEQFEPR